MKTLTDTGIHKIGQRLADSVDHAAYTLDGQPKTVAPFRKQVEGGNVKIYIYFDDAVVGTVADAQLIDSDGDVIANATGLSFKKPAEKGLYIAFKYDISELTTEVIANENV